MGVNMIRVEVVHVADPEPSVRKVDGYLQLLEDLIEIVAIDQDGFAGGHRRPLATAAEISEKGDAKWFVFLHGTEI